MIAPAARVSRPAVYGLVEPVMLKLEVGGMRSLRCTNT
jgi:hypothetical protein